MGRTATTWRRPRSSTGSGLASSSPALAGRREQIRHPRWPLSGLRVLELGNFIAAPTAGRLLADFGADVSKVERPGTGDELGTWRTYGGSTSMLYQTINRNKSTISLDLRTPSGHDMVLRLAARCDAVIENFRPGTLERWGLGPDELATVNPDLVLTRISAYGQTGPLRDRPGFAAVAEAVGGLRHLGGSRTGPRRASGGVDRRYRRGLYAAFGTIMQIHAARAGHASRAANTDSTLRTVDVALNESVLSLMESVIPDFSAHGVTRIRAGGRIEGIAPSNSYACADGGTVVIAGNGDAIFRRLMSAIGRPDLAHDRDLASNSDLWRHRERLDDAIEAWTTTLPRVLVLERLDATDVPSGPIFTAADLCCDAQLQARAMIQHLPVNLGEGAPAVVAFPGVVPVLDGTSLPVRNVGPDLDANADEVLARVLGMSLAEVGEFRRAAQEAP